MKNKRTKDPRLEKLLVYLHTLDAREIMEDLGIEYQEAGKNVQEGWIGIQCPMPGCDDPSTHMGINLRTKSISCFICSTSGTIIKLVSRVLGYNKALEYLSNKIPKELIRFDINEEKEHAAFVEVPDHMKLKRRRHWKYIKHVRKFNPKELFTTYDLQCISGKCSDWEYRNKIFVPVYYKRRLVTFTTIDIRRDISDEELRYIHCHDDDSVIPIKDIIYGYDYTNMHDCIVVEGLFDAWRIGKGAVCVFGTKFTPEQVKLLKTFKRVKLCFDNDGPGRIASKKLASELAVFTEVLEIFIPPGTDPDKLSKKDIDIIKNC